MDSGEKILLFFTFAFAWGAFFFLLMEALLSVPPIHCRYMVQVKDHPGIYSCSQYPRPISVDK